MVLFWSCAILFGLAAIIFLVVSIIFIIDDGFDEDLIGPVFLFVVCALIDLCILFNVDYTTIEIKKVYPSDVTIMYDDEEVIVKYDETKWVNDTHKEYT